MSVLKYGSRSMAAWYLLFWLVYGASCIGDAPSGQPVGWTAVICTVLFIATAMFLGWSAKSEHDMFKDES